MITGIYRYSGKLSLSLFFSFLVLESCFFFRFTSAWPFIYSFFQDFMIFVYGYIYSYYTYAGFTRAFWNCVWSFAVCSSPCSSFFFLLPPYAYVMRTIARISKLIAYLRPCIANILYNFHIHVSDFFLDIVIQWGQILCPFTSHFLCGHLLMNHAYTSM